MLSFKENHKIRIKSKTEFEIEECGAWVLLNICYQQTNINIYCLCTTQHFKYIFIYFSYTGAFSR